MRTGYSIGACGGQNPTTFSGICGRNSQEQIKTMKEARCLHCQFEPPATGKLCRGYRDAPSLLLESIGAVCLGACRQSQAFGTWEKLCNLPRSPQRLTIFSGVLVEAQLISFFFLCAAVAMVYLSYAIGTEWQLQISQWTHGNIP